VLERDPDHVISLHHLGLIARKRGDYAAAARLIAHVLSIRPDYVEILSDPGTVASSAGGAFRVMQAKAEDTPARQPRSRVARTNSPP
jgi:hypothetical protein